MADAIRGAKRGFDRAARMGGEEFAILAPDSDEHGAYMLAERIRAAVHEAFAEDATALTISFGISTHPLHGQSADGLLRTADQALYAAKRLGRNRSVISSAEVPGILAHGSRERTTRRTWSWRRSSTWPRRSTCATPEAPRTASASGASRSSRLASSACRPRPWSAYGSPASCTTWAGWPCPTRC